MIVAVIILAIAVVVLAAIAVWLYLRNRRTTRLRQQFGPEYERTVRARGDRDEAERELEERKRRVERFPIRPLSAEEHTRYADAWRSVQARFVDDPSGAVGDADRLIGDVMRTRGYPVGDFESRAADLSVEYPNVVTNYRAAHRIAEANQRGNASTEDLRQAMVHYRALFDDLLGMPHAADTGRAATAPPPRTEAPR
jgi:predicted nucleic acid-binding protein